MSSEEQTSDGPRETSSSSGELPEIEDAYEPSTTGDEPVDEDDPQLLEAAARLTEADAIEGDPAAPPSLGDPSGTRALTKDDTSDAGSVADEPKAVSAPSGSRAGVNWDRETSAHKIVVELKRVESEVRRLLENRDPKRKRKLAGTRRWHELEQDVLSWRYAQRLDEPTLLRLDELITRRHYLFKRLRFVAGTRPVWNS